MKHLMKTCLALYAACMLLCSAALARAAMADVYGLSEKTMNSLESLLGDERILICGDGCCLMEVTIAGRTCSAMC